MFQVIAVKDGTLVASTTGVDLSDSSSLNSDQMMVDSLGQQ